MKTESKEEDKAFWGWLGTFLIPLSIGIPLGLIFNSKLMLDLTALIAFVMCGIRHLTHKIYNKGHWYSKKERLFFGIGWIIAGVCSFIYLYFEVDK